MKIYFLNTFISFLFLSLLNSSFIFAKSFATKTERINVASRLIRSKQSKKATIKLMSLIKIKEYKKFKPRLYFLLGLSFEQLQLQNSSVWALLRAIKYSNGRGSYAAKSFTRLLSTANHLKDQYSITQALSLMSFSSFSAKNRSKLYYILAKNYLIKNNFKKSAKYFSKVHRRNKLYLMSRYFLALSLVELKQFGQALKEFKKIVNLSKAYTKMRAAGLLGQARVYYQRRHWHKALHFYYLVPRDSPFWVDALQEAAWTELRLNKLDMALRQFQTLHSSYYQERYFPESVILRAVVYLKLCRYQEVKKILKIYNQEYKPALKAVSSLLKKKSSIYAFSVNLLNKKNKVHWENALISNQIKDDFKRVQNLRQEWHRLKQIYPYRPKLIKTVFLNATQLLRAYKRKIQNTSIKKLYAMQAQLFNLKKQKDFIHYELLKTKQTAIKKKIAEKKLGILSKEDEEERKRNFYIQNGYEYWPFQGEYWLDELGNYYYIGGHSCEQ